MQFLRPREEGGQRPSYYRGKAAMRIIVIWFVEIVRIVKRAAP